MGLVQYATQLFQTATVRYVGTSTLREGQILCYQENAPLPDASLTDDRNLEQGNAVEDLNTDNVAFFAGIVSESSVGRVGPGNVDILIPRPGNLIKVEVDGTADVAVDDSLELDGTLGGFILDGTVAAGVWPRATAREAFTTDATLSAIWAFFY